MLSIPRLVQTGMNEDPRSFAQDWFMLPQYTLKKILDLAHMG
jgi:hypothetical protein